MPENCSEKLKHLKSAITSSSDDNDELELPRMRGCLGQGRGGGGGGGLLKYFASASASASAFSEEIPPSTYMHSCIARNYSVVLQTTYTVYGCTVSKIYVIV